MNKLSVALSQYALVALISAGLVAPAAAQNFCLGVKQVLQHAPRNFASLRTTKSRSVLGDPARILIPGAVECKVHEVPPRGWGYVCRMSGSDLAGTYALLRQCFPGVPERDNTLRPTPDLWISASQNGSLSIRIINWAD